MEKIDLIGQRFGRLIVIKKADNNGKNTAWLCLCDCGNKKVIRSICLRKGLTNSCGCLRKEKTIERSTTHNLSSTPTYRVWRHMINRCNNPNDAAYKNYGGRGIKIEDKRWLKFENFFEDMGLKPDGLSIERINNNLGYFKNNCCWATCTTQCRNQRIRKINKTGIKGVFWHKHVQKYQAQIGVNYKNIHLGSFTNLQDAKQARINAEQKYWR